MLLNKNVILILSILFLSFSLVRAIQVFSLPSNIDIRKTILYYLLIYGGGIAAFEIYKGRNTQNYGISPGGVVGATIGSIAGFYSGYQICILVGLLDANNVIESSSISMVISWIIAEIGRQLGFYLGCILFTI